MPGGRGVAGGRACSVGARPRRRQRTASPLPRTSRSSNCFSTSFQKGVPAPRAGGGWARAGFSAARRRGSGGGSAAAAAAAPCPSRPRPHPAPPPARCARGCAAPRPPAPPTARAPRPRQSARAPARGARRRRRRAAMGEGAIAPSATRHLTGAPRLEGAWHSAQRACPELAGRAVFALSRASSGVRAYASSMAVPRLIAALKTRSSRRHAPFYSIYVWLCELPTPPTVGEEQESEGISSILLSCIDQGSSPAVGSGVRPRRARRPALLCSSCPCERQLSKAVPLISIIFPQWKVERLLPKSTPRPLTRPFPPCSPCVAPQAGGSPPPSSAAKAQRRLSPGQPQPRARRAPPRVHLPQLLPCRPLSPKSSWSTAGRPRMTWRRATSPTA